MQKLEKLMMKIPDVQVMYDQYMPKGLSGLYEPNKIRLNSSNCYYKNVEVLAEEIGHHYTSHGVITDYTNIDHMKQEHKARRYAVKLVMPLEKLIECYEQNVWGDMYELCAYLEITPDFFAYALEDYKKQFGSYVKYGGYLIEFDPLKLKKV